MTWLPNNVTRAVEDAGIKVAFATRWEVKVWNRKRRDGLPRHFGGWYWWDASRETMRGPFRTQSAAIRDAFMTFSLSAENDNKVVPMRGWGRPSRNASVIDLLTPPQRRRAP